MTPFARFLISGAVFLAMGKASLAFSDVENSRYSFVGDFKVTSQVGHDCEAYFVPSHLIAQVNFVGNGSRNLIINMRSDDEQGPLLGLNIAGLYGSGDFSAERTLMSGDKKTSIAMSGYVQPSFLGFELVVREMDAAGNMICEAKGDFSGDPGQ